MPHLLGPGPRRLAPAEAAAFVLRACERHGGVSAWGAVGRLSLRLDDLGGALPWLKGLGRTFPPPSAVDLWPHEQRAVFLDYPLAGDYGVYDAGRVSIATDPRARPAGVSHRRTFTGLARLRSWWPQDAIYFFGYALLHYVGLPFTLRDRTVADARRTRRGVELWFRSPEGAETHSGLEGFVFDESGLLVRHDYRTEILGAIFNGAHVGRDHQPFEGLLIASCRTVYVRPWHWLPGWGPVRTRLPLPILRAGLRPR
jgi:hypothetical protein